jgi:hypothetical protein
MNEESKLIELFKKYPELLHAYGGHLLITTTKSNGKSKPRLLQLTKTMLQPLSIILPNIWRNPWVGLMPMTKQHSTIKSLTININQ